MAKKEHKKVDEVIGEHRTAELKLSSGHAAIIFDFENGQMYFCMGNGQPSDEHLAIILVGLGKLTEELKEVLTERIGLEALNRVIEGTKDIKLPRVF